LIQKQAIEEEEGRKRTTWYRFLQVYEIVQLVMLKW